MALLDKEKQAIQGERLSTVSQMYSDLVKQAKEMAIARRSQSPVRVEQIPFIIDRFAEYAKECKDKKKPMTWAGFALSANISGRTLDRMYKGELDHIVEEYRLSHGLSEDTTYFVDENGEQILLIPWSQIVEKCALLIQSQLEENCYQLKGNQVGSIFGLKARFGWQDDNVVKTQNNTLIVADKDRATELLDMLSSQ